MWCKDKTERFDGAHDSTVQMEGTELNAVTARKKGLISTSVISRGILKCVQISKYLVRMKDVP